MEIIVMSPAMNEQEQKNVQHLFKSLVSNDKLPVNFSLEHLTPDESEKLNLSINSLPYEQRLPVTRKLLDFLRHAQIASVTDKLTGLPNRAGIMEVLHQKVEEIQNGKDQTVVLAFIDLDGFKSVNDNLGHDVGDEALKEVANRLRYEFPRQDEADIVGLARRHADRFESLLSTEVARLGGDEMVLVLTYEGDRRFHEAMVRGKIRDALDRLVFWDKEHTTPYPIGASVGFGKADKESIENKATGEVIADLLKTADEDMYKDKMKKHNRLGKARQIAFEDREGGFYPHDFNHS